MKIKFIQDENADDIEIIIRAKQQDDKVENILKSLGGESANALVCSTLSNEVVLDIGNIIIISKDGRYLSVKTTTGEYVISEPLYKIEEKLDKAWFVKISQSEIVNLRYVKRWGFDGGGIIKIELINDIYSYTSRRCAVQIREILKKGGRKNEKQDN